MYRQDMPKRFPALDGCIYTKTVPIYDAACSLVSRRLREARGAGDKTAERDAADALKRLEAIFHEYIEDVASSDASCADHIAAECETIRRIRILATPFVRPQTLCETITDTLLFLELAGKSEGRTSPEK